jgi:hypothetical protein
MGTVRLTRIWLVSCMISRVDRLVGVRSRGGCVTVRGAHARGLISRNGGKISASARVTGDETLQSIGPHSVDIRAAQRPLTRHGVGGCSAAATTMMISMEGYLLRPTLTRR